MAEMVLAGVLGAAVLAIVLLHRNSQRQADRLAKVEAELAAEKIARITQQSLPLALPVADEEPEPVRRKRHLALYIGGSVAAFLASLGSRLRDLVGRRRAVAVTVAASTVLVATSAFAYYKNADSDETPDSGGHAPAATAPDAGDTQAPEPSATDEHNQDKNGTTERESTTSFGAGTAFLGQSGITGDEPPGTSQPDDGDQEARSDQEHPANDASDAPPTPAPDPTQPPAQSPAPPSTTDPEPSQPPATQPPADDDKPGDGHEPGGDDDLCIGVPPILELCLPGKTL
ncbi:hypothetical protein [Streptomyces griseoruber]|uniref:hypothetical protein n=1 Tax=Streptomyces griseoruber TaxID=1943 RepID=UPI0037A66F82